MLSRSPAKMSRGGADRSQRPSLCVGVIAGGGMGGCEAGGAGVATSSGKTSDSSSRDACEASTRRVSRSAPRPKPARRAAAVATAARPRSTRRGPTPRAPWSASRRASDSDAAETASAPAPDATPDLTESPRARIPEVPSTVFPGAFQASSTSRSRLSPRAWRGHFAALVHSREHRRRRDGGVLARDDADALPLSFVLFGTLPSGPFPCATGHRPSLPCPSLGKCSFAIAVASANAASAAAAAAASSARGVVPIAPRTALALRHECPPSARSDSPSHDGSIG